MYRTPLWSLPDGDDQPLDAIAASVALNVTKVIVNQLQIINNQKDI